MRRKSPSPPRCSTTYARTSSSTPSACTLKAYPLFDHFTFDVYDTSVGDRYVGGGDAYHPVGYCYNHWAN
ncbi:hypothetical protein [Kitasatospora sp. NPDC096204]|uniref:hypothetical protein n=1 Tax=Kitasatospora sp. NPDC096204 TaxID=3364094 RepID=UPI00380D0537